MKKLTVIFLTLAMMVAMLSMTASAAEKKTYEVLTGTPTIDGVADDIWQYAEWGYMDRATDKAFTLASAKFKLLHDDQYLYVYAEVVDSTKGANGENVGVYFDVDGCGMKDCPNVYMFSNYAYEAKTYVESTIGGGNTINVEEDVAYKILSTDAGFSYELRFDLSAMKISSAAGTKCPFDIRYTDELGDRTLVSGAFWNVDVANGNQWPWEADGPENFGEITFSAKKAEAPATNPPAGTDAESDTGNGGSSDTSDTIAVGVATLAVAAAVVVTFSKKKRK